MVHFRLSQVILFVFSFFSFPFIVYNTHCSVNTARVHHTSSLPPPGTSPPPLAHSMSTLRSLALARTSLLAAPSVTRACDSSRYASEQHLGGSYKCYGSK